jgi:hypothetical protein
VTAVFLLGTHQPGWLRHAGVPLFICDRRLTRYRQLPAAVAPWALDSGGFTEQQTYGTWTVTPAAYVTRVRRYRDEIGHLMWAAPQDWMCEPIVISGGQAGPLRFAGTGLSVAEHQRRTVANYRHLRDLTPDLPFIPVLQGWTAGDYLRCIDLYAAAGVDLPSQPLVGLGSVCRRQNTSEAAAIITAIRAAGVTRLHGFGFKIGGLARCAHLLTSADSLAWSLDARRSPPLPGCIRHKNCANCLRYALRWRTRVLDTLTTRAQAGTQLHLDLTEGAAA